MAEKVIGYTQFGGETRAIVVDSTTNTFIKVQEIVTNPEDCL